MRVRHFSYKTERAYSRYVRDYILFYDWKHPKDLGAGESSAF